MKQIVGLLAVILALAASGVVAAAQQSQKVPRLGLLSNGSAHSGSARIEAFREGLRELGYKEGKNIAIDYRYAEGKRDRLPELAAELVRLKLDVIVAAGGDSVTSAARNVTTKIPIIMTNVADPVGSGFVASLARPGGNMTGLTSVTYDLSGKRLELLKETFAKITRVAVLYDPNDPVKLVEFKDMQTSARPLAVQLQALEARRPEDFAIVFRAAKQENAGALIVLPTALTNSHRRRITQLAEGSRLPAIYPEGAFINDGGLMSYGPLYTDLFRRAARYVDKILKGANPADLPVEQPTKFEFIVNLKTAKQIGVTIPPNVLARADKVIK
jgi:putative tryptophan/tyrosine transport system substrate-binding protein